MDEDKEVNQPMVDGIDWAWLLNSLDYHHQKWYVKEDNAWQFTSRFKVYELLAEMGISDPNKVMKLMGYRDREAHARSKEEK